MGARWGGTGPRSESVSATVPSSPPNHQEASTRSGEAIALQATPGFVGDGHLEQLELEQVRETSLEAARAALVSERLEQLRGAARPGSTAAEQAPLGVREFSHMGLDMGPHMGLGMGL
jgi:ribosomal protein L16/L10AE